MGHTASSTVEPGLHIPPAFSSADDQTRFLSMSSTADLLMRPAQLVCSCTGPLLVPELSVPSLVSQEYKISMAIPSNACLFHTPVCELQGKRTAGKRLLVPEHLLQLDLNHLFSTKVCLGRDSKPNGLDGESWVAATHSWHITFLQVPLKPRSPSERIYQDWKGIT